MKILIYSDLHTEFAPFAPPHVEADVVVLAGDIGVRAHGLAWAKAAFREVPVVYVPGNHEYYGAATPHLTQKLRSSLKERTSPSSTKRPSSSAASGSSGRRCGRTTPSSASTAVPTVSTTRARR